MIKVKYKHEDSVSDDQPSAGIRLV